MPGKDGTPVSSTSELQAYTGKMEGFTLNGVLRRHQLGSQHLPVLFRFACLSIRLYGS